MSLLIVCSWHYNANMLLQTIQSSFGPFDDYPCGGMRQSEMDRKEGERGKLQLEKEGKQEN